MSLMWVQRVVFSAVFGSGLVTMSNVACTVHDGVRPSRDLKYLILEGDGVKT
jgi:hypothetical protein